MVFRISSFEQYKKDYELAKLDTSSFWGDIAKNFRWFKDCDQVLDENAPIHKNQWFKGGLTNIAYNCLDRHLVEEDGDEAMKNKAAIIFEPNDTSEKSRIITYKDLYEKVMQFANLLAAHGVKAGDRVCIYMPMIPESVVAMLACARIGAVHLVVFAGFSAKALASRIEDSQAKILITSDLLFRGDKTIKLLDIAKEAIDEVGIVKEIIAYKRSSQALLDSQFVATKYHPKISIWQDEINKYEADAPCFEAPSEHPLFILYTSGSTGKPKGITHGHAGYMVYTAYSFKNVFQYHGNQVFFCSADIGWITGHSYLVYGPLLNGATTLMFEGVPTYPTASRFWQIIEKHKVNIFYTAPTAIRSLMQKGEEFVKGHNLSSLKILGSVGEPINEEAWKWYHEKIGSKKCPITDTWWQTETGGIMIGALAGITPSKAAHAGLPLCGIEPILLDEDGVEITKPNITGNLCFKKPWPSMALGVWGNEKKFFETYFERFKGYYFAGDGAFFDEDGLYRIVGRIDDVLKISGHRIGTAEVENAVNLHKNIAESAVIGIAHSIKGESMLVFAIAKNFDCDLKVLESEIEQLIKKEIGSIAKPDKIYIVKDLPKTRSGKIMRRILKKIALGEKDLGDISTLVNAEVVEAINQLFNS